MRKRPRRTTACPPPPSLKRLEKPYLPSFSRCSSFSATSNCACNCAMRLNCTAACAASARRLVPISRRPPLARHRDRARLAYLQGLVAPPALRVLQGRVVRPVPSLVVPVLLAASVCALPCRGHYAILRRINLSACWRWYGFAARSEPASANHGGSTGQGRRRLSFSRGTVVFYPPRLNATVRGTGAQRQMPKPRVQIASRSATACKYFIFSGLDGGICGGSQPTLSAALATCGVKRFANVDQPLDHRPRSSQMLAFQ